MLSGRTVLIVEEAALIAVDIESVLTELGAAHVVTAGGGESVLPAGMLDGRFDLAVVDWHTVARLPAKLLHHLGSSGVPVVLLTTDEHEDPAKPFDGRGEVVRKPFDYKDLCAAIARLMA